MSAAAVASPSGQPGTTDRQPPPACPQVGQVVSVRGATWAVADVVEQGLVRSPADDGRAELQHAVTLQSLEEDRLGDELTVIWEIEVGQSVLPDQGLPEEIDPAAFDDPATLGAFVDAVRWGAVTTADEHAYQAPFRSGATVEAYQLEPLRRALASPRTNLLLADDVGLGKTIEAGLVVQELLLRHRARTAIIVCPPSLALKWQDEMREKFGLDFVIVDSAEMARTRRTYGLAANPLRLYPRVIVSMAWLPTPRAQRLVREALGDVGRPGSARRYAFDILIVDEAHHVAPASPTALSGGRGYAVDSQRTRRTRELAQACEHRLFLSATPHNGHTESFTALLEMVDDRRFSRGAQIDQDALDEVTVRRLKSDLPDKGFQQRVVRQITFTPTAEEEQTFALLDRVLRDSARANGDRAAGDLVALLLKKRFLSSPWSFALTLEQYLAGDPDGGAAWSDLDQASLDGLYDDVLGSGQTDEEEGAVEHPELQALRRSRASDPLSAATDADLDALITWGRQHEYRADSKASALLTWLDAICRPDDATWSGERVVLFTEYADTLRWMQGLLEQQGYGEGRLEVIDGSVDTETREVIRERFTAAPSDEPVRVLLATDAAGEGIDLQAYCHRLVNLDIPFNPSRLEQRIGRIDRYGQTRPPEIYTFAPVQGSGTYAADLGFLERVARKVERIGGDLGSVNEVIDAEIQGHFLPRSRAAIGGTRAVAKGGAAAVHETLAGSLRLNRELTALARDHVRERERMHLTPAAARRVVDTALTMTAQPPLVEVGDDRTDAAVYTVPTLAPGWRSAVVGLDTRLRPGVNRPITFDADALVDDGGQARTDLVHVHLGHPLLQRAARTLRSALAAGSGDLARVTAVVDPELPVSCAAAVCRLVLVGRGGVRLHEEVVVAGVRLRGAQMAEERVERVLDGVLDAGELSLADRVVRESLAAQWGPDSPLRERLERRIAERAEARQAAVADDLERRREADVERARAIYAAFRDNLSRSISVMLDERESAEAMLFPDDQARQRQRDLDALRRRLDELDDEEAREVAATRERYADVSSYVTTAALVFALTPADAEGMSR